MPSVPLPNQWPRGSLGELHAAAYADSIERLVALLSDGSIDIDQQGGPYGYTTLMVASGLGHSRVARILLNKGADVGVRIADGGTALHISAEQGHLAISKMLVNAGANLEVATTTQGSTPLHAAAQEGHVGVMSVLIEAGANPNSRRLDGSTPLYIAAQRGHLDAMRVLLRAKANPLLTRTDHNGTVCAPLDAAAQKGHLDMVRALVEQFGIEGCGSTSVVARALLLATAHQHLDIMTVLMDAGVVDTGTALINAAAKGRELSVKFLLQQEKKKRSDDFPAYVNFRDNCGRTPLLYAFGISSYSPPSPRIVRLLIDAGADTTSSVGFTDTEGEVEFTEKPLNIVSGMLREKVIAGKDAGKSELSRLERIRRLLMRVEAVHAVSLLWPVDIPSVTAEGTGRTMTTSTSLRMMLPILRRRALRPRVLLSAMWR